MRSSWDRLGKQAEMPVAPVGREVERVLVESDVPEMVLLREGQRRYLGILSDLSHDRLRWLHVPLTNTQWAAVIDGALDLFELCVATALSVVDTDYELKPLSAWIVRGSDLEPRNLPEKGAKLPSRIRQQLRGAEKPLATRVVLSSTRSDQILSLGDMGLIATRYQALLIECALCPART